MQFKIIHLSTGQTTRKRLKCGVLLFLFFKISLFSHVVVAAGTSPLLLTTIDSIVTNGCIPYPDSICNLSGVKPGISNVTFGSVNHTTAAVFNRYTDYSCCKTAAIEAGKKYMISITTNYSQGEYVKVWIDYNSSSHFDTGEEVLSGFSNHTLTDSITIPGNIVLNRKLRLRVTSDLHPDSIDACGVRCGESEDYTVVENENLNTPKTD